MPLRRLIYSSEITTNLQEIVILQKESVEKIEIENNIWEALKWVLTWSAVTRKTFIFIKM